LHLNLKGINMNKILAITLLVIGFAASTYASPESVEANGDRRAPHQVGKMVLDDSANTARSEIEAFQ
jgi:hypothetical protein